MSTTLPMPFRLGGIDHATYRHNSEENPQLYVDLIIDEPSFQAEDHRRILRRRTGKNFKLAHYVIRPVTIGNTRVGYVVYRGSEIISPYQEPGASFRVAVEELCVRWLAAVPQDRPVLDRIGKLFADALEILRRAAQPRAEEPLLGGFRKAMDYARHHGPCRIRGRSRLGNVELEFRIEQYMKNGLSHYRITATNIRTGEPHPLPVRDYDEGKAYSRTKALEVLRPYGVVL